MTAATFALIASAVSCLIVAIAIVVWVVAAIRRAPLASDGPMLAGAQIPPGASFHDVVLIASVQGILSHGETKDRDPAYIATTCREIADAVTGVRRAA
ncbi:hypothetical protein [Roseateles sp.]|uniref:hypothetical protein n=1 Tax=Roseateles sp. TaxID=1971397 RepID=UPI0031DF6C44